jgi:predicted nucleic acid-binding protein
MVALIDSSVLIAVERGQLNLDDLPVPPGEVLSIAAVTASELLHGVFRAEPAARWVAREATVERLFTRLRVIPFDLPIARTHARLWVDLASAGIAVGQHDLQMAATALANQARILTRDTRSFPRIPDLAVTVC